MIYNFRVSLCLASWDITQALAEATQRQEDLERQGGSEVQRLQVPNSAVEKPTSLWNWKEGSIYVVIGNSRGDDWNINILKPL